MAEAFDATGNTLHVFYGDAGRRIIATRIIDLARVGATDCQDLKDRVILEATSASKLRGVFIDAPRASRVIQERFNTLLKFRKTRLLGVGSGGFEVVQNHVPVGGRHPIQCSQCDIVQ